MSVGPITISSRITATPEAKPATPAPRPRRLLDIPFKELTKAQRKELHKQMGKRTKRLIEFAIRNGTVCQDCGWPMQRCTGEDHDLYICEQCHGDECECSPPKHFPCNYCENVVDPG